YRADAADLQLQWNALADNSRWDIATTLGWHHQVNQLKAADNSAIGSNDGLAGVPGVIYRQNTPGDHSITDFTNLPPDAAGGACDPWVAPNDATHKTPTCPATTFVTGGPGFLYDRRLDRLQFKSMATRLATGAGHHLIKFGVDFEYMRYDSTRGYSGGTLYR